MVTVETLPLMMCQLFRDYVDYQVIYCVEKMLTIKVIMDKHVCDRLLNVYSVVGNCDFETKTFCTWVNLQNDDFDWLVGSGSTSSTLTGPSNDHTHNQDNNGLSIICVIYAREVEILKDTLKKNFTFLWKQINVIYIIFLKNGNHVQFYDRVILPYVNSIVAMETCELFMVCVAFVLCCRPLCLYRGQCSSSSRGGGSPPEYPVPGQLCQVSALLVSYVRLRNRVTKCVRG